MPSDRERTCGSGPGTRSGFLPGAFARVAEPWPSSTRIHRPDAQAPSDTAASCLGVRQCLLRPEALQEPDVARYAG
jgi:hypothetical protein